MSAVICCVSSSPLCYCALDPTGKIWNFDSGTWEVLESTGTPLAAHLRQLAYVVPGSTGSLGHQQWAVIPSPVVAIAGVYCPVFTFPLLGKPDDELDCLPVTSAPNVTVLIGGIAR